MRVQWPAVDWASALTALLPYCVTALLRYCATALLRYCGAGVTVSVTVALVTVPATLLTVTAKSARLSARAVGGVVWLLPVAPAMAAPFFIHW